MDFILGQGDSCDVQRIALKVDLSEDETPHAVHWKED